jgi:hypothetical protein
MAQSLNRLPSLPTRLCCQSQSHCATPLPLQRSLLGPDGATRVRPCKCTRSSVLVRRAGHGLGTAICSGGESGRRTEQWFAALSSGGESGRRTEEWFAALSSGGENGRRT